MSEVRDNAGAHRFELSVDGHVAVAEYELAPSRITFTHTVVPSELEGRGIGSRLAKAALESARERGLAVTPQCPFIRAYIQKHPEYQELVS